MAISEKTGGLPTARPRWGSNPAIPSYAAILFTRASAMRVSVWSVFFSS